MLLASSVLAMAGAAAAAAGRGGGGGLRWVKGANLTVGGRGFNGTASFWNRLPKSASSPSAGINRGVYGLSRDSAGMSVRFSTNSPTVAVQYTLISGSVDMWHMPSTGVSGADLYVFDPTAADGAASGSWRWVATYKVIAAKKGGKPTVNSTFSSPLSTRPAGFGGEVRYKLHLPTYNGVEDDLAIGVQAGATLGPDNAGPPEPRPIVWYGTSIAQGCCASRPGQIFTNQIARRLTPNRDVINLAFSGSGIMNMGVTKLIATLDVAMIVIDCDWNMEGPMITANMAPLVAYLRANGHATTPIVMAEGTTAGQHWINPSPTHGGVTCGAISCQQTASRLAFEAAFQAIIEKTGDRNLHKVPGDALFHHVANGTALKWEASYEDPTVGGLHPSELGHTRVAEYYQAFLPPLLAASDADATPRGRRAMVGFGVAMEEEELLAPLAVNQDDEQQQQQQQQQEEAAASLGRLAAQQGLEQSLAPFMTDAVYTDFRDLGVHGRAFNNTAPGHYYSRLPAAAQKDVTAEVWLLSLMSTSQYVRFVSDAPTIHFKWLTQDPCKGLWHMPTSGACYLDLYAYDEAVKSWRHVAPIAPSGNSPFYDLTSATKGAGLPPLYNGGKNVSYILYLPVRNTLVDNSSFVGVPTGSYLAGSAADVAPALGDSAPPLRGGDQQIVWYGTSIQQGGVASRAGNLYDAVLGRRLSREVLNFGFAGNGHEDIGVAKYLVTLPAAVIVLDCLPNMNAATVAVKTVPLVKYLRANGHAKTPIVLAEIPPKCESDWFNTDTLARNAEMNAALKASYDNLTASGVTNLHYVKGEEILAGQEGEGKWFNPTVGGTHPADVGQYDMADFYTGYLRTLLGQ